MESTKAWNIADAVGAALSPACERLQIAGSLRRGCADVGDIEVVCISKEKPRTTGTLFPVIYRAALEVSEGLLHSPNFSKGLKWGEKWRQLVYRVDTPDQITVDLFIVQRDSWGPQLAIRTGPAGFSKVLVSRAIPKGFRMDGGVILNQRGEPQSFPEERQFFEWCGLPYWKPFERSEFRLSQFLNSDFQTHGA